jgi:transcriptional regulator with XRE-family HTH domain
MNEYLHPLNTARDISASVYNTERAGIGVAGETQAEKFGEWLREARGKAGLTKAQLAREAKIARSYVTNLEGAVKNVLTDKPTLPKVEIVDRIAAALGVPPPEARLAAGYAARSENPADTADIELQRLWHYYRELPRECQQDALSLMEALWRRRKVEKRPDHADEHGKRPARVTYPRPPRHDRKRNAG